MVGNYDNYAQWEKKETGKKYRYFIVDDMKCLKINRETIKIETARL